MLDVEMLVPETGVKASFWRVHVVMSLDYSKIIRRITLDSQDTYRIARDSLEKCAVGRLVFAEPVIG